jgi:hypothetical protein
MKAASGSEIWEMSYQFKEKVVIFKSEESLFKNLKQFISKIYDFSEYLDNSVYLIHF